MPLEQLSHEVYPKGIATEIELYPFSIQRWMLQTAKNYPQRVALDFFGQTTTYEELAMQVRRGARLLINAGLRPGDRVALMMPNCPQHIVAFYSVLLAGGIVAEHNPLAPASQIQAQMKLHGAKIAIAWENSVHLLLDDNPNPDLTIFGVDMVAAMPKLNRIALRLPVKKLKEKRAMLHAEVPSFVRSWDKELPRTTPYDLRQAPKTTVNDTAVLLHTGGTTGIPKAVMLSHRNLTTNVMQCKAWVTSITPGAETYYAVLPLFHAFGLINVLFGIGVGASIVVFPKFDKDMFFDAQAKRPCTFFVGVPPIFDTLAKTAPGRGVDMTTIRITISGAMSLDAKIARAWEDTTTGLIIEGYGLTETSPVLMGSPCNQQRRHSTLGVIFPSVQARIVNPDNPSEDVPVGEPGELLVRGPNIMQGYYHNPAETAEVMLSDGWLRTGDIVRFDRGFFVMEDRRKEVIISSGFNVYPSQVERVLREMPGVADAAVVGLPDEHSGEEVVAAVVLEEGALVNLDEVRTWAEKSLAHYALPRQMVVLSELPRSQIDKVLRRVVKEQLLSLSTAGSEQLSQVKAQLTQLSTAGSEQIKEIIDSVGEQFREWPKRGSTQAEKKRAQAEQLAPQDAPSVEGVSPAGPAADEDNLS